MTFQLGAALMDACVLAVLTKEDSYGYNLTQKVKDVLEISDSTLYPVLRRLQKEGLLRTYDIPYHGRNRRYYAITATGIERFQFYANEWDLYKKRVDKLMVGGVFQ